jgi:hypothetical protein
MMLPMKWFIESSADGVSCPDSWVDATPAAEATRAKRKAQMGILLRRGNFCGEIKWHETARENGHLNLMGEEHLHCIEYIRFRGQGECIPYSEKQGKRESKGNQKRSKLPNCCKVSDSERKGDVVRARSDGCERRAINLRTLRRKFCDRSRTFKFVIIFFNLM